MAVPNIFGTATSAIPLSQLDTNFATAITLGNTAVYLGNTTTSLGNVTLTNVTISSGNVTLTGANVSGTANVSTLIVTGNTTIGNADTDTITQTASYVASTQLKSAKTATNTLNLAAYDVDGTAYTNLITLTAANAPTLTLTSTGVGTINNMSIGATTASTGAFTSLTASTTLGVTGVSTLTGGAVIEGLTVGLGGSAAATSTAVGVSALAAQSGGANNTAVGYQAADSVIGGVGITAIGYLAASSATAGSDCTAVGSSALRDNTANGSTAVGSSALLTSTGERNIAIGDISGSAITTGAYNVVIGSYTGSTAPISATGSNYIVLSDGAGTVRQVIDSSGNVGIGSTSPVAKLEVAGSNNSTWSVTASITGTTMTVTAVASGTIAVGDLVFGSGLQAYTRVTAFGTGTGGVGTYTVSVSQTVSSGTVLGSSTYANTLIRITDTDTSQQINQPTGGLQFFTSDSSSPTAGVGAYVVALAEDSTPDIALVFGTRDDAGGGVDANERMRIDSSGNVGIGTGDPDYLLDVNVATTTTAARVLGSGGSSADTRLILSGSGNGGSGRGTALLFQSPGSSSTVDTVKLLALQETLSATANDASFVVQVANTSGTLTERMRIDSSGNVGIGATSPLALLNTYQTAGGADANILFQNFSTTTSTTVALYLSPTNGSLTAGSIRAAFIKGINVGGGVTALTFGTNASGADPTEKMRIDSAGNVGIGLNPSVKLDVLGTVQAAAAATQDAVRLAGRAGGTGTFAVTLTPTTLTASRTLTLPDATTTVVGTDATQTLTNKRVDPRVVSAASASSLTPSIATADIYAYTALAAGLTINAPTGTPVDGNRLVFRLLDNGTARALTWNATYTAIGVTLPTTTVVNKTTYVGCIYNANNTRWDVIAVATQA